MDPLVKAVGVVALHEVLDHDLPVERQAADGLGLHRDHVLDVVVREYLVKLAEPGAQRRGLLIEVDEDEPLPEFRPQPGQADIRAGESRCLPHLGCTDESAVEVVRPPVVGAAERPAVAGCLRWQLEPLRRRPLRGCRHAHTPVLADRGHDVDLVLRSASDDHRLPCHSDRIEVTDVGDLVDASHTDPLMTEDGLLLEREEVGICVHRRRKADRGGEVLGRRVEAPQRDGATAVCQHEHLQVLRTPHVSARYRAGSRTLCDRCEDCGHGARVTSSCGSKNR